tara:strand:+ start:12218 stop:13360 length:1143 start_codon:yes stop_codon:yes gene_type:complete
MQSAGIYIHIPFCKVKCNYCDFYSVADQDNNITEFIDSIILEIDRFKLNTSNWEFNSMYIGGGTPSMLNAVHVENVLSSLSKKYDLSRIKEFSIEVNPGETTLDQLIDLRTLGINRLSIGIQSFDSGILKFLTRTHNSNQIYEIFDQARTAGFANINCDLIYSIPGQTLKSWKQDLKKVINMEPEHVSAYTLIVEKGTELYEFMNAGKIKLPDESKASRLFINTHEILKKNGYMPYEMSHFAKNGMQCAQNLNYWRINPCLAFGPSAHGFDGRRRWNNLSSIDLYLKKIKENKSVISQKESLSKTQRLNEMIGFGLKMYEGFDMSLCSKNNIIELQNKFVDVSNKYPNCIESMKSRFRLTRKGLLFADTIISDLMLDDNN